ncbi:MAG: DUF6311 domain-containing protein, partial [Acidobacteriota bacterium]|nr:DUF6311 domain-containing protein [Acidobacteriota bacterium]
HPALCAHWTLLWALHLYFRWQAGDRVPSGSMLLLGAVVGLVHPYLAVMVLALLTALAIRVSAEQRGTSGLLRASWAPGAALAGTTAVVQAGWWVSGMFIVSGEAMTRPGLTLFSMNLLAPITPSGWSSWMPDIRTGAGGQPFEGFQYLGAGLLFLLVAAAARALTAPGRERRAASCSWPLVAVLVVLALYALSPRVTVADHVVIDYSTPAMERLAVFGVTGRFFWPVTYACIALASRALLTSLPARVAVALLAAVIGLQVLDLRPAYAERVRLTRDPAFHQWAEAPRSPIWAAALPHYQHLVLVPPLQCGPAPVTFELPGYLAGLYRLTMNVGEVARASESARARYCADLEQALAAGRVDDQSVYLVHPAHEARFRAAAPSLVCGSVDAIRVCVTSASYHAWRDAAGFH